jgi:flagellin
MGDIGMVTINTNYAAAFAANAAKSASSGMDSAMEKLSTGSRINYAKDDAAGQAIVTRLSAEIQGLSAASRNAADAQSMLDTADGALQESQTVLLRMRELAVQSANGTLTDADRDHTDAEFQQLVSELTRIADNTTFAGQNLLNGANFSFQIGEGANQTISVSIDDMAATDLNVYDDGTTAGTNDVNLQSSANAQAAIGLIDAAIEEVSGERGELGAVSNRLSSTMANLDQINVNLSASRGRIQDADFAVETANLAKNQILQQAATAMLAQANASQGTVLTLIQG